MGLHLADLVVEMKTKENYVQDLFFNDFMLITKGLRLTELEVEGNSNKLIKSRVYCSFDVEGLFIHIQGKNRYHQAKYVVMSRSFQKSNYKPESSLYDGDFLSKCVKSHGCAFHQSNGKTHISNFSSNRNLAHIVFLLKRRNRIEQARQLPIWLVDQQNNRLVFSTRKCFE